MPDRSDEARAINHARWQELATLHGQDDYYDAAALVAGADTLSAEESAAVGDVTGRDVLHVQCHLGFDAISLARRGARVTGVDFSGVALGRAEELAAAAGVDVTWVEADATAFPESLHGRFDLAYATIGVIGWIGDIDAWMRSVAATLRPGGRLVLIDGHPLMLMVDSTDPLRLDYPYGGGVPVRFERQGSYADAAAELVHDTTVEYPHSLGELVSAAASAGLRVDALTEHLDPTFDGGFGRGVREPDGRWRLRVDGLPVPLLFTLLASRPR